MDLFLAPVERPRGINLYLKPSVIATLDVVASHLDDKYPNNKHQHSRGDAVEALVNVWAREQHETL
jgi:hypothetical protein